MSTWLDYWKDGNSCISYLKKVGGGGRGEEVGEEEGGGGRGGEGRGGEGREGGGGGGGMREDEEEDCKTWQKPSGNTTLLSTELGWGLQEFQLLRKRKYGLHNKRRTTLKGENTYICTGACVCVFCVQCNPIFTVAKSTFYKKRYKQK